MRRFFPLYSVYRQASTEANTALSMASFLVVLDPPVIDALAARLDELHIQGLPASETEDLLALASALARDERSELAPTDFLAPFAAAVGVARASAPDEVALNLAALALNRSSQRLDHVREGGMTSAYMH